MIPYILYAALIITACYIFYKVVLRKETFFALNRFVLLSCMAMAFVLPLVPVPSEFSLRSKAGKTGVTGPAENRIPGDASIHQAAPGKVAEEPVQIKQGINFGQAMQWMTYLYWFGVAVFACNFLLQAALLIYRAYTAPVIKDGRFRIVEISGDKAPCSFGNNIFINPAKYDWDTYNQVLLHEKIHIEQKHTVDLLLAELVLIFQWFNPFAWAWRKELENNLEFYTDHKLLQQPEVDRQTYQMSLLKVAAPHYPLSITTNYNQSFIKTRIIMMNAKRSNLDTAWKYFFIIPLLVAFVCFFNEPVVNAQGKPATASPARKEHKVGLETSGNWFATIKDNKINIQFKKDDEKNSYNGNSFALDEFKDLPGDKAGIFLLTREAGTIEFKGKFEGNKGMGEYRFLPDQAYHEQMEKEGIDLNNDEDQMVFFLVNVKRSYVTMLKQQGYTDLDKDKLIPLAALDVNEAYITSIKQAGFKDIDLDNLVPFKAMNIDKAFIEEIRNAGYKDISPDKIITFKAQGIDGKYITDFRSASKDEPAGKGDNTGNNANRNNAKNSVSKTNSPKNDPTNKNNDGEGDEDDLIAFKAMNIDNAFISSFKAVGYANLSNSQLISMKAVGVTPEFIRSFRDAGYPEVNADDLVALKAQDVTPALVKKYKELGFDDVSLDNIIGAKATGTTPAFIKSMREKGHNMKSLENYISLKAVLGGH